MAGHVSAAPRNRDLAFLRPKADYDERATNPGRGLFCDECLRKRAGGACV